MPNPVRCPFDGLPLWNYFVELTVDQPANRKMVEDHIEYALPLLDHFIAAFPTYTLHNRQHQYNIVKLMGELLHDRLNNLTGLETAILILSALYHDIGMVYSLYDLKNISTEDDFSEFLTNNASALLEYEKAEKTLTVDLLGRYCRWAHAKRVWVFLNKIDQKLPFIWNKIPFKFELGNVCESHNESIGFIKNNESIFAIDFLGDCDLMFCAAMLRVADIMDFDDTRTPKSVYEFLDLKQSRQDSSKVSDEEWQKHLSSRGFIFKRENNQTKLLFIAAPEKPEIEIAIRNFVSLIQAELVSGAKLLKMCSTKWRNFEIPTEIDVSGIKSNNYRSGNYHFTLSEKEIIKLLTGENLYTDRYVFLRELLQNAIDASRHREFRERLIDPEFTVRPIAVSYFDDEDGCEWIRVDDFGMGMNEEIIKKHLLNKGQSYYNSDSFKLEKLLVGKKGHVDFVPISRFGIGLLSCFIVGDRIEISTLHKDQPGNAYRLSVQGQNGFFTLQSKKDHHVPSAMPSHVDAETSYRSTPGTSIAVRISANTPFNGLNIISYLKRYLLVPPVPVVFQGANIGGSLNSLMKSTWAETRIYRIEDGFQRFAARHIRGSNTFKIKTLTVDLEANALCNSIKGKILIYYLDIGLPSRTLSVDIRFALQFDQKELALRYTRHIRNSSIASRRFKQRSDSISTTIEAFKMPELFVDEGQFINGQSVGADKIKVSHNGIRIDAASKVLSFNSEYERDFFHTTAFTGAYVAIGLVYLQDELLPELTVSRNDIKGMPFLLVANLLTAARILNTFISKHENKYNFFNLDEVEYDHLTISKSRFYENNKDFWDDEIKILAKKGIISVKDLIKKPPKNLSFKRDRFLSNFYKCLVEYVLEKNFEITVKFSESIRDKKISEEYFLNPRTSHLPVGIEQFPPMTFVKFLNKKSHVTIEDVVNFDSEYSKWYMSAYETLKNEYSFYSQQLILGLLNKSAFYDPNQISKILDVLRKRLPESIKPPSDLQIDV